MTEREAIDALIRVKQCADSGTELVSNQGQALDGYSERAEYRAIIEKFVAEITGPDKGQT